MIFHLRCDKWEGKHAHLTVFCNGANTGTVCMDQAEAIVLKEALEYYAKEKGRQLGCARLDEVKISGCWFGEKQ